MESILQKEKYCFNCGNILLLEKHHIFFGNPWREISEREGFVIYLCPECHRNGPDAPHRNREMDLWYKQQAQLEYERRGNDRGAFIKLIGRNYL